MPLLIATDEAGYGPKLGPLVICASVWQYPANRFPAAFEPLKVACHHDQAGKVRIDDSKKIFIAGKKIHTTLSVPDVIVRAAARWSHQIHPLRDTKRWLEALLPLDWNAVRETHWLLDYASTIVDDDDLADQSLIDHWSSQGAHYLGCLLRLITPAQFNEAIHRGLNKADLLTESTCELVKRVLADWALSEADVTVISDRHGGRAYYAAPLQQVFSNSVPVVVSESKQDSRYQLRYLINDRHDVTLDWSFRVGGDSFSPVGFSSIIAKWVREYSMAGLNQFIAKQLPPGKAIRPTAGYPEDAARFIRDVNEAGMSQWFQQQGFERLR